jgi:ABC-type Fe3+ transport system substrate-binding protein
MGRSRTAWSRASDMLMLVGFCLVSDLALAADQSLIDAAKREGRVTWYTTLVIDQFVRPLSEAFEGKYGIKVEYVRSTSNEVILRITNEAKAGRIMADVIDGNAYAGALRRENLLLDWLPEATRKMPPQYFDRQGYWVATNLFVLTPGFNTDLVPKGTEPRTFEDLLNPRWKGQIAWGTIPVAASAPGFIGNVLEHMGEEKGMDYLRKLAGQDIVNVGIAAGRPLVDMLITGERAIALQIFHHHTVISAQKGAPVDWIPMQPAFANLSITSVVRSAPHPDAGKLLIDFILSREGQEILQRANYTPIDPDVPLLDQRLRPNDQTLRVRWFSPEDTERGMPKWMQILKDLFR